MQKQYINKDFKMLVNTWLFLTLDLYLFKFDEVKGEKWFDNFAESFISTTANINDIDYWHNPIKMMDVVTSVDQKTSIRADITLQKSLNYVHINSHDNIYNFNIEPSVKEVFAIWIKKFDVDNYIVPVSVYAGNDYLVKNDHKFDLSNLVQELDNTSMIKDTLSKFRKIILI